MPGHVHQQIALVAPTQLLKSDLLDTRPRACPQSCQSPDRQGAYSCPNS